MVTTLGLNLESAEQQTILNGIKIVFVLHNNIVQSAYTRYQSASIEPIHGNMQHLASDITKHTYTFTHTGLFKLLKMEINVPSRRKKK